MFPEVRIKRTIEVRCADAGGADLALAFCALFAAILYVEPARAAASELALDLRRRATLSDQHLSAAIGGLGGTIGGRPTGEWADALAAVVTSGLASFDRESVPSSTHSSSTSRTAVRRPGSPRSLERKPRSRRDCPSRRVLIPGTAPRCAGERDGPPRVRSHFGVQ